MTVRTRKQTVFRIIALTILFLIFWFVRQNVLITSTLRVKHKDKQSLDFELDLSSLGANSKQTRRNIIIVSHGRSGSTITGDMFNHHPSVFYLHEPLQTVERISQFQKERKTSPDDPDYGSLMSEVLNGIFRCNFSRPVVEDLEHFYRHPSHPRASHAIASPPLCPYEINDSRWDPSLCPPLTSGSLGKVCRDNYKMTVAKILLSRITGASIKHILESCSSAKVDCKIIFLVRDPRAVIASSRSVNFFKDSVRDVSRANLRAYSFTNCKQTEENLALVESLSFRWRKRIMIQRYEDFAMDPLRGLSRLYDFAGLSVPEDVKTWLDKTTHPSSDHEELRSACRGYHPAFCTVDESTVAVNRWRWKVPLIDIDIMERYCRDLMQIMGYRPVDRSHELLSNISIPLFKKDYQVKGWF